MLISELKKTVEEYFKISLRKTKKEWKGNEPTDQIGNNGQILDTVDVNSMKFIITLNVNGFKIPQMSCRICQIAHKRQDSTLWPCQGSHCEHKDKHSLEVKSGKEKTTKPNIH